MKTIEPNPIVWMDTVAIITATKQAHWVHPYTGEDLGLSTQFNPETAPSCLNEGDGQHYPALLLDLQTANMRHQVYTNLRPQNQAECRTYGLGGACELGWEIQSNAKKGSPTDEPE